MSQVGDQGPAPPIDTTRPSVPRVFNALLGGKDNYQADRDIRDKLLALAPELGKTARDVRAFMMRATRFLAGRAGITQFLDCGPGLPAGETTHEKAQRINRESTVVYVASDPLVLAHGRALAENDRTHFVAADFRDAATVTSHAAVRKYLDFSQPIAVYQVGTLQYVRDLDHAREIMAGYVAAVPSGSYVVAAHLFAADGEEVADLTARMRQAYDASPIGLGFFRSRAEIGSFLDGLELVEPGLVQLADWWPDGPRLTPLEPGQLLALGAVARKP